MPLADERVADLLPSGRHRIELPAVDGDATVLECAALMSRLHSPLLVVVEDHWVRGLVTAAHLLEVRLAAGDADAADQPANRKQRRPT